MRPALKTVDAVEAGEPLETRFSGEPVLLDPAGVAYFPQTRLLVVSDLHLETASSFARKRIFLPPYDTPATLARLTALVAKYDPAMVVSLGDSFHDEHASQRISAQTQATIEAMAIGREVIWVTGNHDPLPPENCPGDAVGELAIGGVTLRHIAQPTHREAEISGHYHPAAVLRGRGKAIRRNCFACDGRRMIMPAFGVFTGGLSIAHPDVWPLFDPARFCAYMLGSDKVYPIGAKDLIG
ncbi:MAG: ligase-associated DNA damage response endonuclease PdeM [Pseudomonadota bacterium]